MVFASPEILDRALELSAARHGRLCPRQVLGIRIGFAGAGALHADARDARRLIALTECDGCFADGVEAATGCTVGHRTLKVFDYGKVAATFVNVATGNAVRISPRDGVREHAMRYADGESRRFYAQLTGYQRMPDEELLHVVPVKLAFDLDALIGVAHARVNCARCGEEVMNRRELVVDGRIVCASCAGDSYYQAGGGVLLDSRFGEGPTCQVADDRADARRLSPMIGYTDQEYLKEQRRGR